MHGAITVTPLNTVQTIAPSSPLPPSTPGQNQPNRPQRRSSQHLTTRSAGTTTRKAASTARNAATFTSTLNVGCLTLWYNAQWHPHLPANQRAKPNPSHSKLTTLPMNSYHKSHIYVLTFLHTCSTNTTP